MMSFLFKSGYPGHREVRFAQMLLLHRSDLQLESMKKHCLEDMPTVIVRMSSAEQIKVEREFVWWNREVLSEFLKEVASDVTSIFFDFAVAFYLSEACHSKIKLPPQDAPQQFKHFVDLINFHFSNPPAFNVEKKMETAIAKEIFAEEKPFLFKSIYGEKREARETRLNEKITGMPSPRAQNPKPPKTANNKEKNECPDWILDEVLQNDIMDENMSLSEINRFMATKMQLERELALVTRQVRAAEHQLVLSGKKKAKGG
ncbi:Oidioi.mRNA.OKI2018_I69.chr2.g5517.t1.cds [Oikopleura dioica]|uniref:Oidioi.mRNA.OKI2018_I69.chr2.g5517.t1.cds n=1 Tax=Oikopleura dioica TaxID=34765 RepID=A0ABN7T9Q3_OIKDI|nr:Oidioi.mRNA.OKI2018_I69.chr2.g5517.t1.cds [Oikopleura dioica]